MRVLDAIDSLSFFDTLTNDQKVKISLFSRIVSYPKNGILYYENETSSDLLFMQSGFLKVYKIDKFENEIFLYHIYQGEMISELSTLLADKITCHSNAEFVEDSQVLAVNYEFLRDEFLAKNILTMKFIEELANKTQKLQCIINRELVFDSTAKVAFILCQDLKIFNKSKRNEISFMLHIQPETLSRVLGKFKRSEFIDIDKDGNVVIVQKDELEAIYKGVKI